MELNVFVKQFANMFDDTDPNSISASTFFRNLPEWSSLLVLSTIVLADEEYGVEREGEELGQLITVEDIFNLIKSKQE